MKPEEKQFSCGVSRVRKVDTAKRGVSMGPATPQVPYVGVWEPADGHTIGIQRGLTVRGIAGSVPTGVVFIDVMDLDGNLIASAAASVDERCRWSVYFDLSVTVRPADGQQVVIYAYTVSVVDGTALAFDAVQVAVLRDY